MAIGLVLHVVAGSGGWTPRGSEIHIGGRESVAARFRPAIPILPSR